MRWRTLGALGVGLSLLAGTSLLAGCSDDSEPGVDQGIVQDGQLADGSQDGNTLTDQGGEGQQASDQGPDSYVGEVVPSNWISITADSFTMGSPDSELCREDNEQQHQVELTHDFKLAETEVTQEQFSKLMGYNPSFDQDCGESCPVEFLTWHEAAAYCNALSRAEELTACYSCQGTGADVQCEPTSSQPADFYACPGYRLPSEAEWELAARAGTQTAFYNGGITSCMGTDSNAGSIGWYKVNSGGALHEVAQKQANDWGLYDMSGNVYEWVQDSYQEDLGSAAVSDPLISSGEEKVFRGGAWYFNAEHMRSGRRQHFSGDKRFTFLGFRCAKSE